MTEIWVPLPRYEGRYEVSDRGRVRSLDRHGVDSRGRDRFRAGRVLTPSVSKNPGYASVELWKNSVGTRRRVHEIVAEAFHGPRPEGLEVLHRNDVKLDNRASNLMYGTSSQNKLDRVRNGHDHNVVKSECPAGHAYTDENTYRVPGKTSRHCRKCANDRSRAWKREHRRKMAAAS